MNLDYIEYIIKDNNKFVKYGITYDKYLLNSFRREICKKCGIRRHVVKKQIGKRIYLIEDFLIENLRIGFIGKKITDEAIDNEYLLEYYLIEEPSLAQAIKKFINENIEDLVNLIHYNILSQNKDIGDNIDDIEYNSKLDLDNQDNYISKLKSLMIIQKISEMDYDTYIKSIAFKRKVKVLETINN